MRGKCIGVQGSSLKRGVGEVRRDGGCEKMWVGVRKVLQMWGKMWKSGGVGKYGRGVGKCFGCGRK